MPDFVTDTLQGITFGMYSHVMPGLQEAAALRFEEGLLDPLTEARKTAIFQAE